MMKTLFFFCLFCLSRCCEYRYSWESRPICILNLAINFDFVKFRLGVESFLKRLRSFLSYLDYRHCVIKSEVQWFSNREACSCLIFVWRLLSRDTSGSQSFDDRDARRDYQAGYILLRRAKAWLEYVFNWICSRYTSLANRKYSISW